MAGEDKTKQASPAILVVALLAFGVVLGGFGLYRYQLGNESASWPSVQGTITQSRAQSTRRDGKQEYMPSVHYTYSVDGASHTGTRITASDVYQKTRSGAEDILRSYPVGAEVAVFYDPGAPEKSVLEAGMPKNVYVLLFAAAACILLAVAVGVSAAKSRLAPPTRLEAP